MTPPLLPAEAWGAEDAVAPAVVRRVGMGRDVLIPADHAEDARQVDDGPAATILQHGADLGAAAVKDAREVGIDDRPPALVRAGIDRTVAKPTPTDAGAIERDIERAEEAAALRYGRLDAGGVRHVAGKRLDGCRGLDAAHVAVDGQNTGALPDEGGDH